jgi:membrane dipeptidase
MTSTRESTRGPVVGGGGPSRRIVASCAVIVAVALGCNRVHDPAITAAPDASARRIHERLLTLDTHLDTPINFGSPGWDIMQRHDVGADLSQVDYPRMVSGGLDGGFWAIYTPQGPRTPRGEASARDAALRTAVRIHEMVARNNRYFELALRSEDAAAIASRGKRVVYLSIENGYPLGHDLTLLQTFYSLGVRLVGPVHFLDNDLGDSSTDPKGKEWQGLSPLGKQLVAEANRLGIVLDGSHASDDVLDQLMALSKTPVILSHSGCKAVFDHPRNVDDDRIRKLAATGGVIQVNSLSDYLIPTPDDPARKLAFQKLVERYGHFQDLGPDARAEFVRERLAINHTYPAPRATLDDFMKHVLHALQVAGPDHVGIGADWDGGGGVTGLEDVADIPRITERLLAAGYSEADLAKIWSGNVLRVLRAAEDAATPSAASADAAHPK